MAAVKEEAIDQNLLRDVGNYISKKCIYATRPTAIAILRHQKPGDFYAYLSEGIAFEEIIDKNKMLGILPFSNDVHVFISDTEFGLDGEKQELDYIKYKFMAFYDIIQKQHRILCKNGAVLLSSINKYLIEAESKFNVNLNAYKPSAIDWEESQKLFNQTSFSFYKKKAIGSDAAIYSLNLDYKGLRIQIMEISDRIVKVPKEYIIENSYMLLLNYNWVHNMLENLKMYANYYRRVEARAQYEILIDNQPWTHKKYTAFDLTNGKLPHFNFDNPNRLMCDSMFEVYRYYINKQRNSYEQLDDFQLIKDSFFCYITPECYKINTYTLQMALFGSADDNVKVRFKDYREYNVADVVGHMTRAYRSFAAWTPDAENDQLPPITGNQEIDKYRPFCTLRFSNPVLIDNKSIEFFNIGDTMTFPSFTSSSHSLFRTQSQFSSVDSPLVIIRFFMSSMSNGKFIYLGSVDQYDDEREVVILHGTTFKILNKSFVIIKVKDIHVQKLLFDVVINDDNAGEYLYREKYAPDKLKETYRPAYATKTDTSPTEKQEISDTYHSSPPFYKDLLPYEPNSTLEPIHHSRERQGRKNDSIAYYDNNEYYDDEYLEENGVNIYNKDGEEYTGAYYKEFRDKYIIERIRIGREMEKATKARGIAAKTLDKTSAEYKKLIDEHINYTDALLAQHDKLEEEKKKYVVKNQSYSSDSDSDSYYGGNSITGGGAPRYLGICLFPDSSEYHWNLLRAKLLSGDVEFRKKDAKIMTQEEARKNDCIEFGNNVGTYYEKNGVEYEYVIGPVEFATLVISHLCGSKRSIKLKNPINGNNYIDKNILTYLPPEYVQKLGYSTTANNPDIFDKLKKTTASLSSEFAFLTAVANKSVELLEKQYTRPNLLSRFQAIQDTQYDIPLVAGVAGGACDIPQIKNILLVVIIMLLVMLLFYLFMDCVKADQHSNPRYMILKKLRILRQDHPL